MKVLPCRAVPCRAVPCLPSCGAKGLAGLPLTAIPFGVFGRHQIMGGWRSACAPRVYLCALHIHMGNARDTQLHRRDPEDAQERTKEARYRIPIVVREMRVSKRC
jgi:hypothetical protein